MQKMTISVYKSKNSILILLEQVFSFYNINFFELKYLTML